MPSLMFFISFSYVMRYNIHLMTRSKVHNVINRKSFRFVQSFHVNVSDKQTLNGSANIFYF